MAKNRTTDDELNQVRPDSEASDSKPVSKKKQTVIMFAESADKDKQEKEMSVSDAEKLIKYEKNRGKRLWVIKEGQQFTENEDGSITTTTQGQTENAGEQDLGRGGNSA